MIKVKQEQRLSNQLKKPEKGGEELKKLELTEGKKSKRFYFTWRDKLQHRDFIGKRGFNKLISPFQEIVESKGRHLFCEHKAPGFVDVVKEFYANMVGIKDKTVYVE